MGKAMRAAVKPTLQDMIVYWHRKFMPLHFKEGARRRYKGYGSSDANYARRKMRIYGHNKPLVFTGETEYLATRTIRTSGTAKKATGYINAPALNFRRLRNFLVATTVRERRAMAKLRGRLIQARLSRAARHRSAKKY